MIFCILYMSSTVITQVPGSRVEQVSPSEGVQIEQPLNQSHISFVLNIYYTFCISVLVENKATNK